MRFEEGQELLFAASNAASHVKKLEKFEEFIAAYASLFKDGNEDASAKVMSLMDGNGDGLLRFHMNIHMMTSLCSVVDEAFLFKNFEKFTRRDDWKTRYMPCGYGFPEYAQL